MIFGNITQEKTYAFLPEDLKECFAYAKEHDLASYEKGCHPIDGERLFVNVVEYETTRPEHHMAVGCAVHGKEVILLHILLLLHVLYKV